MIRFWIILFFLSITYFGLITSADNNSGSLETINNISSNEKDWISIFNGENLDGWIVKINSFPLGENFGDTFSVSDGILKVRYDAYGDDFDQRFGALYFNEKLTNYRLKVVYRFVGETAAGAPEWGFRDSGVQFFCQAPESVGIDQLFPVSVEYNLHGGDGEAERPVGQVCANGIFVELDGKRNETYCTQPSVKRTFHGDQWVTLEIDVNDGQIQHFVNDELILSYSNPTFNPEHEIAKNLIENGDLIVKDGYISLQSNSHPIDFKTIELLPYK